VTATISEVLATDGQAVDFEALPAEVVHAVKRSMLDTLGCALGAFASEPSVAMQRVIADIPGREESTIFGSGTRTSFLNALIVNGVMTRHLDFTGLAYRTSEARETMGHHGEAIPAILALGEKQNSSGREVVVAIALAFELLTKIVSSVDRYNEVLDARGFVHETMRTPSAMAVVGGKLLGLSREQMAQAVGLACGANLELGIMYWCEEEVTMARNLRFPLGAYNGFLGALFAKHGFRGPLNVFEGHHGLNEVVTGGAMKLDELRRPLSGWTIPNTWIKSVAVSGYMQGFIEGTIGLVTDHDIRPEDVAKIVIKTSSRAKRLFGNPDSRMDPKTSYTADHSAYYCTAVAIADRAAGPAQFEASRLTDPKVRRLMDLVSVEADDSLAPYHAGGIAEITTAAGQTYTRKVLEPKGHPRNPMSDSEIESKFRSLTDPFLQDGQMESIYQAVWHLEDLSEISELTRHLVFPQS
jgi:2-methylcitrate dehydratase